jgi:hypothetical protein
MGFQTCKYKKGANGEVESKLFDSDDVPDGWKDSPAEISNNGTDPVKIPESPKGPAVEDIIDAASLMDDQEQKKPEAKVNIFKKKRKKRSN